MKLPKWLVSTLMHAVELAVIIGILYLVTWLFPSVVPSEQIRDVLILVLATLAKGLRASPRTIVPDFVNGDS